MTKWGGRRAQAWTADVLDRYGRVCHLQLEGCKRVATTGDHLVPRSIDESRQYDVTNGRPACLPCNLRRQADPIAPVIVDALGLLRPRISLEGDPADLPPGDRRKASARP